MSEHVVKIVRSKKRFGPHFIVQLFVFQTFGCQKLTSKTKPPEAAPRIHSDFYGIEPNSGFEGGP